MEPKKLQKKIDKCVDSDIEFWQEQKNNIDIYEHLSEVPPIVEGLGCEYD